MAGTGREALLWIADQLCAELGPAGGGEALTEARSALGRNGAGAWTMLSSEDEELLATVRGSLARVAIAVGTERSEGVAERAVCAALDGAELVMRGELASGNAERLPELMPGFVFLVTLPIVEQDRAIELSRRAAAILERASGR